MIVYMYTYMYIYIYIYRERDRHIYIYIYIYIYIHSYNIHPVSITRFPLSRFSPGAGLLRNPLVHRWRLRFSRGWVRKDGNLVTETGCK